MLDTLLGIRGFQEIIKSHHATCRQWHLSQVANFQRNSCTALETGTLGFLLIEVGASATAEDFFLTRGACFTEAPGEEKLLQKDLKI